MHPFTLSHPPGEAEAIALRRELATTSAYLAGGTTLIDLIKLDVMQPDHVINLNRLELSSITTTADGGMRLGGLVRNSDLAWHTEVRSRYPVLAEALLNGASPQIRNMATVAGNVLQRTRCPYFRDNTSNCNKRVPGSGCAAFDGFNRSHAVLGGSEACVATHPSDMCVALAALEAQVQLQGRSGTRTMPLTDFLLLPGTTPEREHALRQGELITAILVPPPWPRSRSWYVKARERDSFAFALASAAVVVQLKGDTIRATRIALGGVATKPWRAIEAEEVLRGAPATRESFEAAAEAAFLEARPLRDNAFKIPLAKRVLVRALELVCAGQPEVRQV